MAGLSYIIVDAKTRKTFLISFVLVLLLFAIGIIIGYSIGHGVNSGHGQYSKESIAHAITSACGESVQETNKTRVYFERYLERHSEKYSCLTNSNECWDAGLPRHYIAYHLNGRRIKMDGKLDEEAWSEVQWSEKFVDMRSTVYPDPHYDTKFKMRWDENRLYIGAYIQEKDLWATLTAHDSKLWTENGFGILLDVDGSMFNYKQVDINVRGAVVDLLLYKSYRDAAAGEKVFNMSWDADALRAVYAQGTINMPNDTDKFWSFEMSLSFSKLAEKSERNQPVPADNEVWFMLSGRAEKRLIVNEKGQYEKSPDGSPFWWTWQPCYTLHAHLQDRWGLLQFKRNIKDKVFKFDRWHIYKGLFETLIAVKQYKAINGYYTDNIEELDVPPYLVSRMCVDIPKINLRKNGNVTSFDIAATSMLLHNTTGRIRSDRYVTFK